MHIGQTNPAFSDPPLEAVDVRQIYDKFPEKKGGLKELYEKGPPNAFFLVKFWVSCQQRPPQMCVHTPLTPDPALSPRGLWTEVWRWLLGQEASLWPPPPPDATPAPSSRRTSTAPSRRAREPSMGSAPSTARPTA